MRDSIEQKFSLSTNTEQKLQLTLGMRESLNVLQMPILELSSWLEEQIENNPLLDWKDCPPTKRSLPIEMDIIYEASLFEHLMQQARENIHDTLSLKQIEWIIGNLDDTGFFTMSFDSAPDGWREKDLIHLLHQVQQFDPPGIGARNLQESLLLQLRALGKENNLSYLLVNQYLEDILQGKLPSVQKKCKVDESTLYNAIHKEIGALDPYPGLRFQKKTTPFITPDVLFIEEEGTWKVEINEEKLPLYEIKSISSDIRLSSEDQSFCKKHINQAKWIENMIKKRRQTLHKVANFIVKTQISYLKEESSSLLPLSIKEVAKELDLHDSTITRAVSSKFLACRWGIIPLKNLLSKHLNKNAENVSFDQTQKLMQKLIAEESKKSPLSDQELVEKMQKTGIQCARRTVTKYRKSLNIPSKRFRRKVHS
jgi:RNA polymerase sigma-54 factor